MTDSSPAGRIRARTKGVARRVARRLRDHPTTGRLLRPTVSVILPIYNVEDYLAECLDSIAAQSFTQYELLVVDDGSPDGSRAIAEDYAARDHRIKIITRPNGGLGAARNTGVRAARGTYLTFVDSDDKLPPHALATLVGTARESGSEIVVGAVKRFDGDKTWRPAWVPEVHAERRLGIRARDFHPLLRNLYTWNKLFRRDFFLDAGLWFREGVAYEDQPIITQLYLRATSIDVVPEVVYSYRERQDRSSISQQTATMKDLLARTKAFELSREALLADGDTEMYHAWLQTLFDSHLHWYLMSSGTHDDEYWTTIRDVVRDFTEAAPQELWERTPPLRRLMLELARQDRRADLQEVVHASAEEEVDWPTEVRDDGVLLRMPFHGDPTLPDWLFVLPPEQLKLAHAVERLEWISIDGQLACRISGWAYVNQIDLSSREQQVRVRLRGPGGAERLVEATGRPESAYMPPRQHPWCDYTPGTFEAVLPVEDLVRGARDGARWRVDLEVEVDGFVCTAPITRLLRSGSPGAVTAGWLEDGRRAVWEWRLYEPLVLAVAPAKVRLSSPVLDGDRVRGRLEGPAATSVHRITARSGKQVVVGTVARDVVELVLPGGAERRRWQLIGRTVEDRPIDVVWPHADALGDPRDGAQTVLTANVRGDAVVEVWRRGAEAHVVEICGTDAEVPAVRVSGHCFGAGADAQIQLVATGPGTETVGPSVTPVDGAFVAELSLDRDLLRFGRHPLGIGEHSLSVRITDGSGGSADVLLRIAQDLSDRLPIRVDHRRLEARILRGPGGEVMVQVVRPLGEQRGRYRQKQLELVTSDAGVGITRGILFRSYFGEQATDTGLSVQAELARRGSDLPVYWAVQSYAVPVPDGATPVIVGSKEWHQLLRSIRYYVDNMYQPEQMVKRDGQVLVQTFHGYPFKQMGLPHWRNLGFPQSRIDSYAARAKEWDYLVSPASYATPLLCRDFLYDGEVLEIGYPRNDVLLSEEAPSIRATVRESLGIRDDQVAVLYAPTFRDYLSPDDNAAEMVDFFDFDTAYDALGDDYVILVRGHAFNARSGKRIGDRPGCIDVTDYPEISDLYLAADTAIVDYSSLRFDFGVTGKPMIFHVPDLQRYKDTRGWLFDFEPTAPGPLLDTTAEVVDAIADLAGVGAQYSAAYERFRSDFLELEDGQAGRRFVDAVLAPRGDG